MLSVKQNETALYKHFILFYYSSSIIVKVKVKDRHLHYLGSEVKTKSLQVLSLLPKDVSPKWRIHIFRQAAGDTDITLRRSAMANFPMLLQHSGPNANHLVYELVQYVWQGSPQVYELVHKRSDNSSTF